LRSNTLGDPPGVFFLTRGPQHPAIVDSIPCDDVCMGNKNTPQREKKKPKKPKSK
jgi:hypothetical protein